MDWIITGQDQYAGAGDQISTPDGAVTLPQGIHGCFDTVHAALVQHVRSVHEAIRLEVDAGFCIIDLG